MDGVSQKLYIATPDPWWFTGGGGDAFVLPPNGRAYLSVSDHTDPDGYFRPNLLGGSVEFDVDMHEDDCGCVAAFYTVGMPGHNADGSLFEGDKGQYYCDANAVGGNFCPEFDIMEANLRAFQVTPHPCDEPTAEGYYGNCDRSGACYRNSVEKLPESAFGPGPDYTINSLEVFHVKIEFEETGGEFTNFISTFSQGSASIEMRGDCPEETKKMTNDLKNGMVFALSNWYGGYPWLDKGRCEDSGACQSPTLIYTNMEFNTGK